MITLYLSHGYLLVGLFFAYQAGRLVSSGPLSKLGFDRWAHAVFVAVCIVLSSVCAAMVANALSEVHGP